MSAVTSSGVKGPMGIVVSLVTDVSSSTYPSWSSRTAAATSSFDQPTASIS